MDETKKEIKKEIEKKPKKRRLWPFLLIVVVVLAVVFVVAYRGGTGLDALHRYFTYGSTEKNSGTESFLYDASTNNRFAALDDSLVVLSERSLKVLSGDGGETWSTAVEMTSPTLATGGGYAVAYDIGGTQLFVVNEKGKVFDLTADEEEPLIAATLNDQGYLAVTAKKKNYKGCVSVYDGKMEKIFDFNSSERFVTDAWVTDDDKNLAAVTLGQESSVFISNIVLYDLKQTEPKANYSVTDGLVLSIREMNGKLATVSDTALTFGTIRGEVTATYDYGGEYLREFAAGEGYEVLLLNRYQSGNVGRLVTVNASGEELATLDVGDEIRSISAAGRYVAVLYADSLVIYTQALEEYSSLSGTDYAKSVLMRDDGSALLISSEKAELFLP